MSVARIAFSEKYFECLSKLTPEENKQANKSVLLFQGNPLHPGLHYEKLEKFRDSKLRSIRANQDVRIILAVTETEELYLLL